VTSSRDRSFSLGNRLAVSLATAKHLPSAKDSFLSPDARTSKAFSDMGLRVERLQTLATCAVCGGTRTFGSLGGEVVGTILSNIVYLELNIKSYFIARPVRIR